MSEKLPAVKPTKLIRVLEQKGWKVDRIRGSHYILVHEAERRTVPVPVHRRDLKTGTLAAVLRIAGISRDEFRELLKR